eukprot:scaffold127408_cov63-Phaeocystis_antarctica.AAC.2
MGDLVRRAAVIPARYKIRRVSRPPAGLRFPRVLRSQVRSDHLEALYELLPQKQQRGVRLAAPHEASATDFYLQVLRRQASQPTHVHDRAETLHQGLAGAVGAIVVHAVARGPQRVQHRRQRLAAHWQPDAKPPIVAEAIVLVRREDQEVALLQRGRGWAVPVGLPVVCVFSEAGACVIGAEDAQRVKKPRMTKLGIRWVLFLPPLDVLGALYVEERHGADLPPKLLEHEGPRTARYAAASLRLRRRTLAPSIGSQPGTGCAAPGALLRAPQGGPPAHRPLQGLGPRSEGRGLAAPCAAPRAPPSTSCLRSG